jgi:hypothetical protein
VHLHRMSIGQQVGGHGQAHLAHPQKDQLHAAAITVMAINWLSGLRP